VDLHLMPNTPTQEERAAIDVALGPEPAPGDGGAGGRAVAGGRERRERRHLLLPALHAVQDRMGWISRGALNEVGRRLTVPPAEAYGVATFYALLSLEPSPPTVLHVCDDVACRTSGAEEVCAALEREVGPPGTATADGSATWKRSPCLGACERAPAVLVRRAGPDPRDSTVGPVPADGAVEVLVRDGAEATRNVPAAPQTAGNRSGLRLLRRVGLVDPESLDDHLAHGGSESLRRAVELGPAGVIREVADSKLLGRGGAAFPTGAKWEAVAGQPARPHYFVCNADESEPGTFKDRVLMEEDPFAVIEALTVAGFATGAELGFIYLRGEYPLAARRLEHAIAASRAAGLLGDDVLGGGFRFDVELRRGAGAYICGEETALFNSIEGKRGEPRNKPPFPVERGLFGKPTGINNVETLLNVLEILRIGSGPYAAIGTEGSTGPRLFCLSGCVERPGVYEAPHGITLRELLATAGGVRDGRALAAVLLGGAAGVFVGPDDLDLRLSMEDARAGGYTLGSGALVVFDETVDLVGVVLRVAAFFRDESCGQCVPCRVGTVRQEEALHRLVAGRPRGSRREELQLLGDVALAMRDASICGLGQTAASAVQSAVDRLGLFGEAVP
jgi:NADH-quinone oxidoreductase subunit F